MGTELEVARPTTLAMHAGRCAACRSEANILASSQSPATMQTSTQPLHCVCPSNRTNDWHTRSSPPLERQSMSRSRHGRRSYNVIPSRLAPQPGTCCQLPRHTPTNMTANTTSAVRQRPRNFHARAASNACAIGVAGKLPTSCHQHLRRSAARIRRERNTASGQRVCRDNRAYSWDWECDSSKRYLLCIVPISANAQTIR